MAAAFMVYSSASLMQLDGSRLRLGFELVVAQVCSLCIVPCLEGLCVSCGHNLSLDPTNCTSEAEEIGRDQCSMVQRFRTLKYIDVKINKDSDEMAKAKATSAVYG